MARPMPPDAPVTTAMRPPSGKAVEFVVKLAVGSGTVFAAFARQVNFCCSSARAGSQGRSGQSGGRPPIVGFTMIGRPAVLPEDSAMPDSCRHPRASFSIRLAGLVALAACGIGLPVTEAVAQGVANADRISALVKQLGSEDFSGREAASDELTRVGLPAFASLEAAVLHPDREVRYRSVRILGQIRELDLQRRLEAFLS